MRDFEQETLDSFLVETDSANKFTALGKLDLAYQCATKALRMAIRLDKYRSNIETSMRVWETYGLRSRIDEMIGV